jgi:energy-coupling factor transporter ATP-binding protein EcfA2
MMEERNCSQPDCYPDDTGCQCGEIDLTKCKHYKHIETVSDTVELNADNLIRFPWTGSALGLHDLNYISAHSNLTIIGVVGTAGTGKTTFLALLYCLLRHGKKIGNFSFVGSYTFTGWEDIAFNLSWKNEIPMIQFPPHTTSNSGRIPGLLHLALKDTNGVVHDIIFTDAPGEWFKEWSINKNDEKTVGANWIYENANSFLMFADCDKLSGTERGSTKNNIKQLLVRLSENIRRRPICLIWSKSDKEVNSYIKEEISKYFSNHFNNNCSEFNVSVYQNDTNWHINVLNSIDYLLSTIFSERNVPLVLPVFKQDDLFLARRK